MAARTCTCHCGSRHAIASKATKALQLFDISPVTGRHTTGNMMYLPDHVLVNMLEHLPVEERLSSCSLVSKWFRHAAAAATTSAKLSAAAVNHNSFNSWIKQHGQHVSSLEVATTAVDGTHCNHAWPLPTQVLQQLPNLKTLHLSSFTNVHDAFWQHLPTIYLLQDLGASIYHKTEPSTVSTALLRLKSLKRLLLDARTFTLTTETFPELQQLTGLEQLSLTAKALQPELLQGLTRLVDLRLDGAVYEGNCSALLSAAALLTELTRLELSIQYVMGHQSYWPAGADANYAAFTVLESSSKLQHLSLRLHLSQSAWAAVFHAGLQLPDLKVLEVDTCGDYIRFGHSETPGLSQLAHLQTFCLDGGQLDARVPLAMPKLYKLQLNRVKYFDHSIPRHENIVIPFETVGEELLKNIAQLQQLVYVEEDSIQSRHEHEHAAPGWSDLGPKEFTEQRLQHIWQGMSRHLGKIWRFAVREQLLPYLSGKPCQADSLVVSALCQLMFVDSSNMSAVKVGPCTAAQLKDLVQKSANLRSCAISLDRSASVDLSVLSQLRGLTELTISNVDPAAVGVLQRHAARSGRSGSCTCGSVGWVAVLSVLRPTWPPSHHS